jgi:hypothetical protein
MWYKRAELKESFKAPCTGPFNLIPYVIKAVGNGVKRVVDSVKATKGKVKANSARRALLRAEPREEAKKRKTTLQMSWKTTCRGGLDLEAAKNHEAGDQSTP